MPPKGRRGGNGGARGRGNAAVPVPLEQQSNDAAPRVPPQLRDDVVGASAVAPLHSSGDTSPDANLRGSRVASRRDSTDSNSSLSTSSASEVSTRSPPGDNSHSVSSAHTPLYESPVAPAGRRDTQAFEEGDDDDIGGTMAFTRQRSGRGGPRHHHHHHHHHPHAPHDVGDAGLKGLSREGSNNREQPARDADGAISDASTSSLERSSDSTISHHSDDDFADQVNDRRAALVRGPKKKVAPSSAGAAGGPAAQTSATAEAPEVCRQSRLARVRSEEDGFDKPLRGRRVVADLASEPEESASPEFGESPPPPRQLTSVNSQHFLQSGIVSQSDDEDPVAADSDASLRVALPPHLIAAACSSGAGGVVTAAAAGSSVGYRSTTTNLTTAAVSNEDDDEVFFGAAAGRSKTAMPPRKKSQNDLPQQHPDDVSDADHHIVAPHNSDAAPHAEEDNAVAANGTVSLPTTTAAENAAADAEERSDPVRIITNMLLVEGGRKTLSQISGALEWDRQYEPQFGDIRDYVTSYQSIFLLSPVGEVVVLRQLAFDTGHRRPMRPTMKLNIAKSIGSCSYSVVSKALDLQFLDNLYTSRGLVTARLTEEVLHVSDKTSMAVDLFLFHDGGIVWWGMERSEHWIIEDDFLSDSAATRPAITDRHAQHDIDHLFPVWFTYHVDESCDVETVMEKLEENICFDHFVLPGANPKEMTDVKLAIAHALGSTARVDYFEYATQHFHDHVIRTAQDHHQPSLWRYFERKRELLKIEGALQTNVQLMDDIGEASSLLTFFWENPRYKKIYKLTMEMQSVMLRKEWFSSKCEAAIELIRMADNKLHRMFMIRSDWVLIMTLMADVVFLLLRLVYTIYFKTVEAE